MSVTAFLLRLLLAVALVAGGVPGVVMAMPAAETAAAMPDCPSHMAAEAEDVATDDSTAACCDDGGCHCDGLHAPAMLVMVASPLPSAWPPAVLVLSRAEDRPAPTLSDPVRPPIDSGTPRRLRAG